jgi:hypothetical protein
VGKQTILSEPYAQSTGNKKISVTVTCLQKNYMQTKINRGWLEYGSICLSPVIRTQFSGAKWDDALSKLIKQYCLMK